jgi:Skp family chaperone for outer membrane proteins
MKEQDNPTLFEIIKKNPEMSYNEANKVLEDIRLKKEAGACITSGMKRDRKATDKMKNRTQEDRGPLDLTRRVEESQDHVKELDKSLAVALEINESHQRYNGKLQTRVTELEEDNKKLARQVMDLKLNHVRKAGF